MQLGVNLKIMVARKSPQPVDIVTWWGGKKDFAELKEAHLASGITEDQFDLMVEWDEICRIKKDRSQADRRKQEFQERVPSKSQWFEQEYLINFLAE